MFEIGDQVVYKNATGKVIFICEYSLSILIGDEMPKANQTRLVVYHHDWSKIKVLGDSK